MNLKYSVISESNKMFNNKSIGTSLVVQWLRFCAPNVAGSDMIPGQGTRSHIIQLKDTGCWNKDQISQVPQLKTKTAK